MRRSTFVPMYSACQLPLSRSAKNRRDILHLATHQHVAMRPHRIRAQQRIGSTDDHSLAAARELRGDAFHPAPLADLAGDADEIGGGIENRPG